MHNYRIESARLFDTGRKLTIKRLPTADQIDGLPARSPDPIAPIVELRVCNLSRSRYGQRCIGEPNPDTLT